MIFSKVLHKKNLIPFCRAAIFFLIKKQMRRELSISQNEFVHQFSGLKIIMDKYCLNTLPPFLFIGCPIIVHTLLFSRIQFIFQNDTLDYTVFCENHDDSDTYIKALLCLCYSEDVKFL